MAHVEDRWQIIDPEAKKLDPKTKKKIHGPRWGKGSRWLAVWFEADGTKATQTFKHKAAAEAHIATVNVDTRSGTYITQRSKAITVAQYANEWLEAHPDWSESNRARNTDILRVHVLPRWGDTRLADITEASVQGWVNGMTGKPGTLRRNHQVLSGILTLATRRKVIPVNEALHVSFPRGAKTEMPILSVPEVDAFIAAHPEDWRTWAEFLVFSGVRISEGAGVRIRHLDLKRRRIRIEEAVVVINGRKVEQDHLKTDESEGRSIPLVTQVVDHLAELVEGRRPDERIFTGRGGVSINRANYTRRQFRDAVVEIGRPELTPHKLRHTAVSLAIRSGASPKAVAAIAGHADVSMTLNVYSHLFPDDLDLVSDRMEAHIEEQRQAARRKSEPPESHHDGGSSV